MGVFSKLKDVLFDVDETTEIPVITREKKEEPKREENPIKEIKMPKEDYLDEIEPIEEKKEIPKKEFNFPMDDFDDELPIRSSRSRNDFFDEEFTSRTKEREPKREVTSKKRDEYEYDYSRLNVKNNKKEEHKSFTPSPVISPVYGILDQNYTKDDVIVKNVNNKRKNEVPNLDDVRKKAYAKSEEFEEEALVTLDDILVDKNDDVITNEPQEEMPILDENKPIGAYDEIIDKPYIIDEDINEKTNNEKSSDDLESDLFSLIDSMYEERNEREEEE